MYRQIDIGLSELNKQLLTMAGYVEQAIETSTQAWKMRTMAKVRDIYAIEQKVNAAHLEVDDQCIKLIALQQPMAHDLRTLVSIIKINTDLERMVDLAVNIGQNTEYFLKSPPALDMTDLEKMSDEVRLIVREVLDAFVKGDSDMARTALLRDDTVDDFKREIFDRTKKRMMADPSIVEQGLNVILIAKNLERIGDHATNIAEDVIYIASGEDIRHAAKPTILKGEGE